MAKWQVESNDKEQELIVARDLTKSIARGICAAEGVPYFEYEQELNKNQQHYESGEAAERKEKVRRLYQRYRADDGNLQLKAIKERIARELNIHLKTVERYLRESKK